MVDLGFVLTGDIHIEEEQFDLLDEINGLIGVFKILCDDKKLKFEFEFDPAKFDFEVISDKKRLKQMLFILLNNSQLTRWNNP
jgi:signal transduction histidine kinase